jgi:hypothetical protein
MVTRYGMTDALGPMVYAENEGEVFLGRSVTKTTNMSEQTMQKVDGEVRRIIDEQYTLARGLIEDNSDKMHAMAKALLEWETIDSEQIDDIMAGKEPRPPKDWTPRIPPSGSGGGSGGTPAGRPTRRRTQREREPGVKPQRGLWPRFWWAAGRRHVAQSRLPRLPSGRPRAFASTSRSRA